MDRRNFLSALGTVPLAWPGAVAALARNLESGGAPDDEAFWAQVRGEFLIPPDRMYFNNGTLGPTARSDSVAKSPPRTFSIGNRQGP